MDDSEHDRQLGGTRKLSLGEIQQGERKSCNLKNLKKREYTIGRGEIRESHRECKSEGEFGKILKRERMELVKILKQERIDMWKFRGERELGLGKFEKGGKKERKKERERKYESAKEREEGYSKNFRLHLVHETWEILKKTRLEKGEGVKNWKNQKAGEKI